MTLISHRSEFIFLRTHKTGSTSVEAALEPACLAPGAPIGPHRRDMAVTEFGIVGARGGAYEDRPWRAHMSARLVRRRIGRRIWRRYRKIAVVRNPFDRMVSMFFWRLDDATRQEMLDAPFDQVREAFQTWIRGADAGKNLSKLCIGPRYVIDHILYFERLEADFAALAQELGLSEAPLPRYKTLSRSRDEPWSAYYDAAAQTRVARASAFELAQFGYDFSGGPFPKARGARLASFLRASPLHATNAFRQPSPPPSRFPS